MDSGNRRCESDGRNVGSSGKLGRRSRRRRRLQLHRGRWIDGGRMGGIGFVARRRMERVS